MGFSSRAPYWLVRSVGYASFLVLYATISLVTAISYPSTRFSTPRDIGGGILLADGGDIYNGQVTYLGLPLRFLTWREEVVEPRHDAPKKTVAVRFGVLAAILDVALIASVFIIIAATGGQRWRELSIGRRWAVCLAVVTMCIVMALAVSPSQLLEPINPYAQ